ncbi:MAG: two-component regulator propeller domain-containing protein [Syntrophothermus sp.]
MKKLILFGLLLHLFVFSANILSQDDTWKTFLSFTDERAMAFYKNEIWIGYLHGIIKFDTLTGKTDLFRKQNSLLPGNMVGTIAIDSVGIKWAATYEEDQNLLYKNIRLSSYDGFKWTVYKEGDALLGNSLIQGLAVDKKGVKWIASLDSGLISFDGSVWKKYTENTAVKYPNRFLSVRIGKQDTKWFGCDSGLIKYDGSKFTLFVPPLEKKTIGNFAIDDSGSIWAAVNDGLLNFNDSNWTHITYQSYFDVSHITTDRAGNIWMLNKGKLLKYDRSGWTEFDSTNSNVPFPKIIDLEILKDGSWRIFSDDGRFVSCRNFSGGNSGNWTVYTNPESNLPFDYPGSIAADPGGNLWIGSSGYGLAKYDGSSWKINNIKNSGLPSNFVNPVVPDKKGNIWLGTSMSTAPNKGSLTKFDGMNWTVYDSAILPANSIQSVAIDTRDIKWIGAGQAWLFSFNDSVWTNYTPDNSPIPNGYITGLAADSAGSIWFASVSWPKGYNLGLVKFDGQKWSVYKMDKDVSVTSIVCDKTGAVWLGTFQNGLFRFDGTNWKNFPNIPYISSMALDKEGVLWIAAEGFSDSEGGLIKFKDSTWMTYNIHNSGLSSLHLSEIAIDRFDNKWITTNGDGLIFFGKENLPVKVVKSKTAGVYKYSLDQNYPNPFNPVTTIRYSIGEGVNVRLTVYDILGREVAAIVNEYKAEGSYTVKFNGSALPAGIYIYTIQAGRFKDAKKIMLLK